jgi:OmpA-OmpF porin, OOP family
MKTSHWLPLALLVCAAGCAKLPPRPVPQNDAQPERPAWYPQPEWNKEAAAERVYLEGKIVFHTASAVLRPESERVLRDLLTYLNANPDITRVRLEGHTDSRATEEYNEKLAERRAIAVADWLVDHGLDHDRILAVAFGELRPLWPNTNALAMQENRRTEFHVAEINGNRFRGDDPTAGGMVIYVKSKEERDAERRQGQAPRTVLPPVKVELDVIKPVEKKPEMRDPLDEPEPPATPPPPPAAEPAPKDA